MRKVFVITSLLLAATQGLAGDAGSIYSMFGIGDLRYYPSARSAGMGYTGIGLPSANNINSMSPASWSRITKVRMEANGLYEGINTAETNKALYQSKGSFNGAILALPISPENGIVFVGGFSPYSHIGYNASFDNTQNGVSYRINEIGSGGLTKAQVGLSYAPLKDFSLGASVNYLFGNMNTARSFIPFTEGTSGATFNIDEENRGVNFTFSGIYTGFGSFAEGLRPLSLGFVITTQSNLKTDIRNSIAFISEADTIDQVQKRLSIPVAFGVGVGYQLADRWLFAADFYSQAWRSSRLDGAPLPNIRNMNRFGIGAEKLPLRDASGWFDKLSYRLGFSYNSTYFKVANEPINEWAVTGGFTIPVSGETRLNVGIEYAQRGVKQANLVKDNILRVSLGLSIVEPWFVRFEEE